MDILRENLFQKEIVRVKQYCISELQTKLGFTGSFSTEGRREDGGRVKQALKLPLWFTMPIYKSGSDSSRSKGE